MVTVVFTESVAKRLHVLTSLKVESGGVLLASLVRSSDDDVRLLVNAIHEVTDEAYERREAQSLRITSDGYVPALGLAELSGAVPIWFHTHPGEGSSPKSSIHDKKVDEELSDLFRLRASSDYYGAIIVSPRGPNLAFTGHIDDGVTKRPIDRMFVIGQRFFMQFNQETELRPLPNLFDRNIRAFGDNIQRVLGNLKVAVVGCGGTGSAVSEQLVRLGVRNIHLIDPDTISVSNVTRVYGSTISDISRPKVDALGDYLVQIAPQASIAKTQGIITIESVASTLIDADVIFGCTDDNAGRMIMSRIASFFLIPVIDCGVILTSDVENNLIGVDGRVTVLHPGAACLQCRGRLDLSRAASELLSPEERKKRVDEGYAPALAGIEPSVVSFTTVVAATAVSELLERFIGYGPDPVPNEIILRLHEREISTNQQVPNDGHYCDPKAGKIGIGKTKTLLELTWQK